MLLPFGKYKGQMLNAIFKKGFGPTAPRTRRPDASRLIDATRKTTNDKNVCDTIFLSF